MQINLRKAQKLRKSIEAALASFSLVTTIGIDVDDSAIANNPEPFIEKGRTELKIQMGRHIALSSVLARLRISIDKKNFESGVDELLAQTAHIDRSIRLLSAVSQASRDTTSTIKNKIKRLQTSLDRSDEGVQSSYRTTKSSVLNVNMVDQTIADDVASSIVSLRRNKEEFDDRRLELNSSTTIEIEEDDVKVLRDLKII